MPKLIQEREAVAIIRRKKVQARTGLSCSTIYAAMAAGTFPMPIKIGPRAVGWIEGEITQWLDEQIEKSRKVGD